MEKEIDLQWKRYNSVVYGLDVPDQDLKERFQSGKWGFVDGKLQP